MKFAILSEKRDSNPRPRPWQGRALPTELFSHYFVKNVHQLNLNAGANIPFNLNSATVFVEKNKENCNALKIFILLI